MNHPQSANFTFGPINISAAANSALSLAEIFDSLQRHARGDSGIFRDDNPHPRFGRLSVYRDDSDRELVIWTRFGWTIVCLGTEIFLAG